MGQLLSHIIEWYIGFLKETKWPKKIFAILFPMVVILFLYSCFYLTTNWGVFKKLLLICIRNPATPITIVLLLMYGLYHKIRNPIKFIWREFLVYFILIFIVIVPVSSMLYYYTTDLKDIEVWNGVVKKAVHEEEYTEESETCDDEGNCTTTYIYHPDEYKIFTSNDELIYTNRKTFYLYVSLFGNNNTSYPIRYNQSSIGDGRRFTSIWKGSASTMIPTAIEHDYVNYVKASDKILRVDAELSSYSEFLLPYPEVYTSSYGHIEINRVLDAKANIPDQWKKKTDKKLDNILVTLGAEKEVNILIYFVGITDQAFFYELKDYWINGKKNDVVIIVGMSNYPKIDWVDVMAWTNHELFKIELKDNIFKLKNIEDNAEKFVDIITQQINAPGDSGYERLPMEEKEYLVYDINLPIWAICLLILLSISFFIPVVIIMLENDVRKY